MSRLTAWEQHDDVTLAQIFAEAGVICLPASVQTTI